MTEFLGLKKYLGLNKRVSTTDMQPMEWMILNNFSPFIVPGRLTPDKGYAKKFSGMTALTDCYILAESRRQDNAEKFLLANDGGELWLWVNNTKQSSAIASGLYKPQNRHTFVHDNVIRLTGMYSEGDPFGNPNATVDTDAPKWMGHINRQRFEGNQILNGYYALPLGCYTPAAVAGGSASEYKIGCTFADQGAASGLGVATHYYKYTFLYDGFQESPPAGLAGAVTVLSHTSGGTADSIRVSVAVAVNINPRITGINIYRSTDNAYFYYLTTLYLDDSWDKLGNGTTWTAQVAFFDDDGSVLTQLMEATAPITPYTTPMFVHGIVHKGILYGADVKVGLAHPGTDGSLPGAFQIRRKNMYIYSRALEYDVMPATNYNTIPDEITALGKTNNFVVVWSKKHMYFVLENQILERKDWMGCTSQRSVAFYDDYLFWANRTSVFFWNGIKSTDILSEKLKTVWKSLSDAQVEAVLGIYDPTNQEYILIIPTHGSYCYNWEFGEWRQRSFGTNMRVGTNDQNGAVLTSDLSYIYAINSGYTLDGSSMICQARSKKFSLDKRMHFELIRLFMLYACASGTLTVKFYKDDITLIRTLTLDNQASELMLEKSLAGYESNDSIFLKNMQIDIKMVSPVANDHVNEIGLEYNLHDLF